MQILGQKSILFLTILYLSGGGESASAVTGADCEKVILELNSYFSDRKHWSRDPFGTYRAEIDNVHVGNEVKGAMVLITAGSSIPKNTNPDLQFDFLDYQGNGCIYIVQNSEVGSDGGVYQDPRAAALGWDWGAKVKTSKHPESKIEER
ncbi:MAG TPA: hypothetical protein VMW10_04455 [Alphaproteobacteria bacterium]|nr:hypothetical protein [Alphaproteobacteria bacterium]